MISIYVVRQLWQHLTAFNSFDQNPILFGHDCIVYIVHLWSGKWLSSYTFKFISFTNRIYAADDGYVVVASSSVRLWSVCGYLVEFVWAFLWYDSCVHIGTLPGCNFATKCILLLSVCTFFLRCHFIICASYEYTVAYPLKYMYKHIFNVCYRKMFMAHFIHMYNVHYLCIV